MNGNVPKNMTLDMTPLYVQVDGCTERCKWLLELLESRDATIERLEKIIAAKDAEIAARSRDPVALLHALLGKDSQ